MYRLYPYKLYYDIVKHALKGVILRRGRTKRSQDYVESDYNQNVWSAYPDEYIMGKKVRPELLHGELILCRSIDHRKFFLEHLSGHIKSLQPKNIFELGSGAGINLITLAVMHPEVKEFTGIELTANGVKASNEFLKNPPIKSLMYLTGETESTIKTRLSKAKFEFIHGDMTALPWKKPTFDFSFSLWVLEQVPLLYGKALSEANRVTKGHAAFLEAWKEAQRNIFERIHLHNVDYFHAPIADAEKAGFKIEHFEPMALTKIKFTNGCLLCKSGN